jgi:YgiT-type zinc finger domain-containing protein
MPCKRCGGGLIETSESLPYIGPRGCLVELRDVRAIRCAICGVGEWHLPELQALDVLIRALAIEQPHGIPPLVYKHDHWTFAVRPIDDELGETTWPRA